MADIQVETNRSSDPRVFDIKEMGDGCIRPRTSRPTMAEVAGDKKI